MPYVETGDGTSLFYADWGVGPPVVFVHGWSLHSGMWEYQLPSLTDHGLRCVAYDRRGHGRSDQPGRGYDSDTLADDLAALLNHLDLRGVTLVAHSMGAGEVVRYLARHRAGRVARIALIAATTPCLMTSADTPEGVDRAVFDATAAALRRDRPGWFAAGAGAYFALGRPDCRVPPALVEDAIRMCLATPLMVQLACFRAFTETDFCPDLRAVNVPALVIHGDADQSAPLDRTGRRTAAGLAHGRLVVYEGAPHGLYVTEQNRLNDDLLAFVRG